MNTAQKHSRRNARARKVHTRARLSEHPRLLVFRSNRTIHAQIIDDASGKVLCGASGVKTKETGVKAAAVVGKEIAEAAKTQKVTKVAFDRNGYKYHGQVKALAEAAREAGLTF